MVPLDRQLWWNRATRDQRLAQIDAAIEIGLNSSQTRVICECENKGSFTAFCAVNGRRFVRDEIDVSRKLSAIAKRANRRRAGISETVDDGAFSIFERN